MRVKTAVPVLAPFDGLSPTICELPIGSLPSRKLTVPAVAGTLLVTTVAVNVTFCFVDTTLGEATNVIALFGAALL